MRLSEVFATIQGEGLLAGVPSLFIRTTGCNLRCSWCDTPYTSWIPEGEEWSEQRILEWVSQYSSYRHVVITGGEPMIQPSLPALTAQLHELGHHITIETAGTVDSPVVCDLMSISPKLRNSTPWDRDAQWAARHEGLRYQPGILRTLESRYDCQWKFVVTSPEDLAEVQAIMQPLDVASDRVLLMPEGTQPDVLRERARWLVEECKSRGYRYCPRLHVELWGNRRGV